MGKKIIIKILSLFIFLGVFFSFFYISEAAPIIANHTVVDWYDDIPPAWIVEVKKMWLDVPGESHSFGYRRGLQLLAAQNANFPVSVTESGTPEAYRENALRVSRASWGDVDHATLWRYSYGEEDFWTSATAIARTKNHLTYSNTNNLAISAFGFGWCWDMNWHNSPGGGQDSAFDNVRWAGSSVGGPEGDLRWGLDDGDTALTGNSVNLNDYITAVESYIQHAENNSYPTKVFFTTGPPEYSDESGYQRHLKNEYIRTTVDNSSDYSLFDYADILSYNDAGHQNTALWSGNTFEMLHEDHSTDESSSDPGYGDHISDVGALRLGKAMWWMLARMAGWDGTVGSADSTKPTVNTFTIPSIASSLSVSISAFTASDNVGVTGYRLTESSTAPTAGSAGWTASAPTTYTFSSAGTKTLYAWAKDAAGNVSTSRSDSVVITLPTYTIGGVISGLNGTVVLQNNAGNNLSRTTNNSFSFATAIHTGDTYSVTVLTQPVGQICLVTNGSGTVAAANITNVLVTCDDNSESTNPTVDTFTIPSIASSLSVSISAFTASDNVGVTGYRLTESSTAPTAGSAGWTASAPTTYTFSSAGTKTLYAWAKDAAGNVSTSRSDSVVITLSSGGGSAVHRFWSNQKQGHFFTQSESEANNIIANDSSWSHEGIAYNAFTTQQANTTPIYRFWSQSKQHHFFTASATENANIQANDSSWSYEGVAYHAYATEQANTAPVYRFWSNAKQGHFFTTSATEKNNIIANDSSWSYEGIAWYVPTS